MVTVLNTGKEEKKKKRFLSTMQCWERREGFPEGGRCVSVLSEGKRGEKRDEKEKNGLELFHILLNHSHMSGCLRRGGRGWLVEKCSVLEFCE